MTLNNLGAIAQQQGDYLTARLHYEESLKINRKLGDTLGVAQSLYRLGILAETTNHREEAA